MANKKTNMSKLRQMLRLYAQGESKLKISELTGVSRNTLKKYLKIYAQLRLSIAYIEQQSDQELDHLFGENLLPYTLMVLRSHNLSIIISNGSNGVNRSCILNILPGIRCILTMREKSF